MGQEKSGGIIFRVDTVIVGYRVLGIEYRVSSIGYPENNRG